MKTRHNSKKRISIFSQNCFLQCDIDLISELAEKFEVQWVVAVPRDEKLAFPKEEIIHRAGMKNESVIIYRMKSRMRYPRCAFEYWGLIRLMKKFQPDVIYMNASGIPWLSFVTWLGLPAKKTIWAIHDVKEHSDRKWTTLYKKSIYSLFSAFHVLSKNQMQILERLKPKAKIYYAPHAPISYGAAEDNPTIREKTRFLFFGNIASYKGLDVLIQAAQMLWESGEKRFEVQICGAGKHWEYCSSLIKNQEPFQLTIRFIENQEIPGLFSNADWLVLPYNDVTQSGPMALAFQYNLPYLTSRLPEFAEYDYAKSFALNFEKGNPKDLCALMGRLVALSELEKQNIRSEFSTLVREKFCLEACNRQYLEMFDGHARR